MWGMFTTTFLEQNCCVSLKTCFKTDDQVEFPMHICPIVGLMKLCLEQKLMNLVLALESIEP